ncbi:MAG: ABC transporter substrate-binding protein [Anaerolineae bacterium]|nr:ABC transporter substrate-binding protein [Anaerolineae bacterium]MDW8172471.1 ABC transporter substrate-binding protein [Anaerolineae bacterium]
MSFKRLLVSLSFGLLIAVSNVGAQDEARFLLTFIPNVQFSPMYVAVAEGHMARAGLPDVQIEYLNEPDVIDLVAVGQADFGIVSGEQAIQAHAQGRPILYVYEWFDRYPIGIVFDAVRDVKTVRDLVDLRIGLPGRFGASYSGLVALLRSEGLTEEQMDLQEIGFNAADVFCMGAVQASVVYSNNEPLQIARRAADGNCGAVRAVRVLEVSDKLSLVSNGLITRQTLAEERPDYVRAVVAAWDAGLRAVINNPARAYLISADYVENLPLSAALRAALEAEAEAQDVFLADRPSREAIAESRQALAERLAERFTPAELIQFEVLLATIKYWDAEVLGETDPKAWETMLETLLAMGVVAQPVDLSRVYSNDFLPEQP